MIDKKMVILTVKQRNNEEATENIIYHGTGEFTRGKEGFEVRYFETAEDKVLLTLDNEGIILNRYAEVHTEIKFKLMSFEKVMISSSFGVMEMESYTHYLAYDECCLRIQYDLVSEKNVIASHQLEWIWEET